MNYLLSINRFYIVVFASTFFLFFLVFISFKYFEISEKDISTGDEIISKADITEPKFAINGSTQKIIITAKEGNFIGNNKVLLKQNVKFESNKFVIETNDVIFDRESQTAVSHTRSKFNSQNTQILAEGFDIYDNGDKIKFFGKARIILEWNLYYL